MSDRCSEDYAASAMQYLNLLCDRLDRNEPIRMPAYKWFMQAAAPVAFGFCVAACANSGTANTPNDKRTGAVEVCNNDKDDDNNGLIDCNDPACRDHSSCMAGVLYAGPEQFFGKDPTENDKITQPPDPSGGGALYAGPDRGPGEESNDYDSRVDCKDPKYRGYPQCGALYAGPPPPASDNEKNDKKDGKSHSPHGSDLGYPPPAMALYGAPPPPPGESPR